MGGPLRPVSDPLEADVRAGVELFGQGRYFESHERFEDAWRRAAGDERLALQGLVQIAAGCHKLGTGPLTGAVELLGLAADKLSKAGNFRGLSLSELSRQVRRAAEAARGGDPAPARSLRLEVLP